MEMYTQDWFSGNLPLWEKLFEVVYADRNKKYNFLEIGSFEGRSTKWLCSNILKNPSSKVYCIDTWSGGEEHANLDLSGLYDRFINNLQDEITVGKVIPMRGYSNEQLMKFTEEQFDFIYIDGSHVASDVLLDLVYSFNLAKSGAVILCDDYGSDSYYRDPAHSPKLAIDTFTSIYYNKIDLVHSGYQFAFRKR
jgi:predicted O-methyltransferase YrrM